MNNPDTGKDSRSTSRKRLGSRDLLAALLLTMLAGSLALLLSGSTAHPAHGFRLSADRGDGPVPVESFKDLSTANTQLQARALAPFTSSAPGAYSAAVAQRAVLARAPRAAAATNTWSVAGRSPECASATSDPNVCPPASAENGQYNGVGPLGFQTLSGRISSLAYDPTNRNRLFASPVVGGVWESRDAGRSWRSIGDSMSTQTVGAIAYDAPRHEIIAATGDNSYGGDGIAGHGVLFSTNDGRSWQQGRGIPDNALGFKVAVSPADPSGRTVYAALSKGLFRTTDGGASWVNVKLPTSPAGYSPNCAGATNNRLCFFANDVTDVIVKAKASAAGPAGAVIAAVGWRAGQRKAADANGNTLMACRLNGSPTACLQAPQNGLYTSASGAPGTFRYLTPAGTSGTGAGLPATAIFGRTALAIAHGAKQNGDAVYALVEDAQKFQGCPDVLDQVPPACNSTATGEAIATVLNGMFVSYDFGKTWTKTMDSTQLKQLGTNSALLGQPGYGPGVQGWYNLWIEADPSVQDASGAPTRVLFGLEEIWENNPTLPSGRAPGSVLSSPYTLYPGGTFANDPFIVIGRYWNACGAVNTPVPCNANPTVAKVIPGTTTHPDQHAAMFVPDGKGGVNLYTASDGGVFNQHVDPGAQFSNDNWGAGLNRTISAVQPYDAEIAKDGTIVAGLQDNGEMKIAPSGHESEIFGGDAFYTTIDPNNSNNILEEYTYGALSVSNDGGTTFTSDSPTGADPTGTAGTPCSATTALFATPIEQDPTTPGHVLVGCTQIQENTNVYNTGNSFSSSFDLSTLPSPNGATNVPSALGVRGANQYVAYCGYCDPATQKLPFANGIATNVGGAAAPKIGSSDGWHKASAKCTGCGTRNGLLPERYINSIQLDPRDPNTVYVTLGGYGRRWIPPGAFGEDVSNVGVGHLFVSHDHGEHFRNITGNLPDISANWSLVHDGKLVVATDLGVYIANPGSSDTRPSYSILGRGLPAVPVFTVRQDPARANRLLIATFGRGSWFYTFPKVLPSVCPAPVGSLSGLTLGRLRIGETKAAARRGTYRVQRFNTDNFCLFGGQGIRAVYRGGRIDFLSTANPFYSVRGVRPGTSVRVAVRRLRPRVGPLRIGRNVWYLSPGRRATVTLKTRAGRVDEVGIANRSLTGSRRADRAFLVSIGG